MIHHDADKHRCDRTAEAAEDRVDPERHALFSSAGDQPGDTDGMVNRSKKTDKRKSDKKCGNTFCCSDHNRRGAGAKEEDNDHADLAPPISDPAGRQTANAKQYQPDTRQTQHFAIREAKLLR